MILGMDVGSLNCTIAGIDDAGGIVDIAYEAHHGKTKQCLLRLLGSVDPSDCSSLVCTDNSPRYLDPIPRFNTAVSVIQAARHLNPEIGSLLHVGAERFFLIQFDENGRYRRIKNNSSCAAGTGSFLDQQARRLGLNGSGELAELAAANRGNRPKLASRCSVFAKTDLIHAQQEGYLIEEICDGLCFGLARNLVDSLVSGPSPAGPIVMNGGVALNSQVAESISSLLGREVLISPYPQYAAAIGACLEFQSLSSQEGGEIEADGELQIKELIDGISSEEVGGRKYYYPPLKLRTETYPDFSADTYFEIPGLDDQSNYVEVELFNKNLEESIRDVYLGIDIGSTSTKAVLLTDRGEVYAGFYTRTSGRPLSAVKSIFHAIEKNAEKSGASLRVIGAGTTGSGRKFIGTVIGADLVLDEITAHARAAYELNPDTDTIIEIGGQDAKFTSLKNGMVSFAQMNTVCAAGTGSFLEEQAAKLGLPLSDYDARAMNARAPLSSDRCTVFMERDINHYLSLGYETDEILAAALHSVRDNYLQKVAARGAIGNHICFQGATAKNKGLVAAFEQKLQQPIFVSRYCHLTGSLGTALILREEAEGPTSFRGIDIYKQKLPVRSERCELCANHCRLRLVEISGQTVAYGFLCGRDYDTKRYVAVQNDAFNLLAERGALEKRHRHKILQFQPPPFSQRKSQTGEQDHREQPLPASEQDIPPETMPSIGIPNSLHLHEEALLWEEFFCNLGFPVVSSKDCPEPAAAGRKYSQAEFCAPITELHGHVKYLLDNSDYIFLPHYIEIPSHHDGKKRKIQDPKKGWKGRNYCFYTQYSTSVISDIDEGKHRERFISPLIGYFTKGKEELSYELWTEIDKLLPERFNRELIARAYERARRDYLKLRRRIKVLFTERQEQKPDDLAVVLAGRPYTLLSASANKNIPGIFASQGVDCFFQDMLPSEEEKALHPGLLASVPWKYAYQILQTAEYCIRHPNLYPVFVTSFQCSPDSFVTEYFKRILEEAEKPYLILQVDDHDSSIGYETRIEAALRAFRNHYKQQDRAAPETGGRKAADSPSKTAASPSAAAEGNTAGRASLPVVPRLSHSVDGKTLLFPNWDNLTNPLLVENLRSAGVDARLLEESSDSIQRGMRHNTGQCIPISIITEEVLDYIHKYNLDPAKTIVWMVQSGWTCNFAMYPQFMKGLFETEGRGMEKISVYGGEFSFIEFSAKTTLNTYFAYLFGGLLRRIGCRTRPYELYPGSTNQALKESAEIFKGYFRGETKRRAAIEEVIEKFRRIPVADGGRPKVAVFGDLYVRDNDVISQGLIETIESAGGEVVTTPYSEYVKIIAIAYLRKMIQEGAYGNFVLYRSLLSAVEFLEGLYYRYFEPYLGSRSRAKDSNFEGALAKLGLLFEHSGESYDNALKISHILKTYPDISLFVQASPAFCCPSIVTEAMGRRIEEVTGVPVTSITYDGTGSAKNESVIPFVRFAAEQGSRERIRKR